MKKPIIQLSHANGFPVGSYKQLLTPLAEHFNIHYIEKLGHNPQYPVNNNWHSTAEEIIKHIETNADEAVIGIGHSYGSISTLIAATKRPDLFKGIVMCEPPLVMSWGSLAIKFFKAVGLIDKYSPAGITQGRQQQFKDHDDMLSYCKSKSLFQGISDTVLMDYIQSATSECDGGICLNYSVDIECEVFRTMPDNLECLPVPKNISGHLLVGKDSGLIRPSFEKRLCRRYNLQAHHVNGGHLFPLQHPKKTAELLHRLAKELSV